MQQYCTYIRVTSRSNLLYQTTPSPALDGKGGFGLVSQATPFNLREKEGGNFTYVHIKLCCWNVIMGRFTWCHFKFVLCGARLPIIHIGARCLINNERLLRMRVTMVTLKSCNLIGCSKVLEHVQLDVCKVTRPSFSWRLKGVAYDTRSGHCCMVSVAQVGMWIWPMRLKP